MTGGLGTSEIDGALKANGNVFLINPDGILFGQHSVVDVGGLVATTNDIKNEDFMAGRYVFGQPGKADASVVNAGSITAATGGFAALVAPGVRNSGTISARLGKVGLAAANGFTLDFYGDQLLTLNVGDEIAGTVRDVQTGETLDALVKNEGALKADGGVVQLTAAAARKVVDSVINTTGIVEANSVGMKNGKIVLSAATADTKPAGTPTQRVKISGTLAAAGKNPGETGGKVQITGEDLALNGASIDASGPAGGGTILIGGDVSGGHPNTNVVSQPKAQMEETSVPTATNVAVDPNSTIDVSATENGDGGKAVVWADFDTAFAGTIYAKGGDRGGDGGFAEISGGQNLDYAGATVNVAAPFGTAGTVLFDPYTATPITAANVDTITNILNQGNGATAIIYGGSVSILTNIFKTAGTSATLKVFGDDGITIASGVTIGSSLGALNILLDADADINSHFNYGSTTYSAPFANSQYPGTATTSEQIDTYSNYLQALYSAFTSYVLGGKTTTPTILTTSLLGKNVSSALASYASDPVASSASKLTANGANFYTNGGSFTLFENAYVASLDTRGMFSVPTAGFNFTTFANGLASQGHLGLVYAIDDGTDTNVFFVLNDFQRVAGATPSGVSYGSMVPPNVTTSPQAAALGLVDVHPLEEFWGDIVDTVFSWAKALIPEPFATPVSDASAIYGAANTAADITVELDKAVKAIAGRNKQILDAELAICSSTHCSSSDVDQAVEELLQLPGFGLNSMGDIVKLLKLKAEDRPAFVRKLFIEYALQNGHTVDQ